jgi:GAF domain-containing protein
MEADLGLHPIARRLTAKSLVAVLLIRREVAIGALALGSRERGGFSDTQIQLLQTFAEQAVIAITSAETYRALQGRTSDLQEAWSPLPANLTAMSAPARMAELSRSAATRCRTANSC